MALKEILMWKYISFYSVKLRIKSFRVPELFIEIPETATVGSLKVLNINPTFLTCIAETKTVTISHNQWL